MGAYLDSLMRLPMLPLLLDAAARATLLFGIAAVVSGLFRRRSASSRHLVWSLALVGALLVPLAALVAPRLAVPLPAVVAESFSPPTVFAECRPAATAAVADVGTSGDRGPGFACARGGVEPQTGVRGLITTPLLAAPVDTDGPALSWQTIVVSVWLVGATLLIARLLLALWSRRRLAQTASDASKSAWRAMIDDVCTQLEVRRPVRVLLSRRSVVPMT